MRKDTKAQIVTVAVLALVVVAVVAKKSGWKASSAASAGASILSADRKKDAEPRDTIYRMLDAARDGDVEAYIDCHSGDMRNKLAQSREEMTAGGFAKYLQGRNREIKGIAINEPERASNRAVQVRVEYVYQDRNEAQQFYLEKLNGEWKIARVDQAVRVPTLVPYGTPVY